jgi:hypothetical protein
MQFVVVVVVIEKHASAVRLWGLKPWLTIWQNFNSFIVSSIVISIIQITVILISLFKVIRLFPFLFMMAVNSYF